MVKNREREREFTCIHLDSISRPIRLDKPFKFKSAYLFKVSKKGGKIAIQNSAGKYLSYQTKNHLGGLKNPTSRKIPMSTWVDNIGVTETFQVRCISNYIHLHGNTNNFTPLVTLKTGNDQYYLDIGKPGSSFVFTKAKNDTDKSSWFLDPFTLKIDTTAKSSMVNYSTITFRHMDGEYLTDECNAVNLINTPPSFVIVLLRKTGEGSIIDPVENVLSKLNPGEEPKTVVITTTDPTETRYLTCDKDGRISFTRSCYTRLKNLLPDHAFELGTEKSGYQRIYSLKSKKTGQFLNITAKNFAKKSSCRSDDQGRRLCLSHNQKESTVWSLTHTIREEYQTIYNMRK